MESRRDAHVVAAHVEGLHELQVLRDAFDLDDLPFADQFALVFEAAVAFYRAAIPLRALILTDHELAVAQRRVSETTGLGPQLPCVEVAHWLDVQRRRGRIDPSADVQAIALATCGSADYIATLHLVLHDDDARSGYGDVARVVSQLLPLLVPTPTPATVDD